MACAGLGTAVRVSPTEGAAPTVGLLSLRMVTSATALEALTAAVRPLLCVPLYTPVPVTISSICLPTSLAVTV